LETRGGEHGDLEVKGDGWARPGFFHGLLMERKKEKKKRKKKSENF
jgi:hypothetical protein